jgi:heterotetrameric sarcosine oxidase gamma subunit
MADRVSPLSQSHAVAGLSHRSMALLLQYHAWPERYEEMAAGVAAHCGAVAAPEPGRAVNGTTASLLRIHPHRLWLISEQGTARDYPPIAAETGAVLDLSHARSRIHVEEGIAPALLSRFVAVDLRPYRFAVDDVALTPIHRVSVVLWRRANGIDILAPRSFARSIWDVLAEAAERLG